MDKVIVERPRVGGHGARKGRPARSFEDQPSFIGLRRQVEQNGDWKSLNENLSPLRRFIEKQVGRPWNKVFSEIHATINARNTVQAHVLTHIDDFIHRKARKIPPTAAAPCGIIFHSAAWPGHGPRPVKAGDLYVDPDDGLIKRARRKLKGPPSLQRPI